MRGAMQFYKVFSLICLGISCQIYAEGEEESIEVEDEPSIELTSIQSASQELPVKDQPSDINQSFYKKNQLSSIGNSSLDKIGGWSANFYLFGQLETILPGGGLAVRIQKGSMSFEGASSFILHLNPAIKSTASLINNFNDSGKGWYTGFGAGAFIAFMDAGPYITLDIPVFFGYQMAFSFWDIGVDFLPLDSSIPLPTLRFGLAF